MDALSQLLHRANPAISANPHRQRPPPPRFARFAGHPPLTSPPRFARFAAFARTVTARIAAVAIEEGLPVNLAEGPGNSDTRAERPLITKILFVA